MPRGCAQALENQFVYFPPPIGKARTREEISSGHGWCVTRPTEDGAHRVLQGLFSGVRGTSFINTVLNRGYMEVAKCEIEHEHRVCGTDVKRVQRGDDIWVSNGRLL